MQPLVIGDKVIPSGKTTQLELPVAKLYTDTDVSMPIHIIRSKKEGPTFFISAAVHGDELNGIEIIRRLIKLKSLRILKGTLIAVPIVNVYGVLNQSRYMPDRRDLNRCFPGSEKGSMAGRVAYQFLNEIVSKCDYGIDLHTGAIHRSNLPQIRANLDDEETRMFANAFGAPVLINSTLRDGSLREAATEGGTKILLYEAGQALRFDELSIRIGLRGILNVLSLLEMIKPRKRKKSVITEPYVAYNSSWVRANASGIVNNLKNLGNQVKRGDILAEIGSPFGDVVDKVTAPRSGIIIGKQNIPLVQEGDAMFHVAFFKESYEEVAEYIEEIQDSILPEDPSLDELMNRQ
jgi:predicted deacylase